MSRFGNHPVPPPRPVFEPTPWFWLLVLSVLLAAIGAFNGYPVLWWYVGIVTISGLIIYGFVRNDTR
jgi:hypothetical protein